MFIPTVLNSTPDDLKAEQFIPVFRYGLKRFYELFLMGQCSFKLMCPKVNMKVCRSP